MNEKDFLALTKKIAEAHPLPDGWRLVDPKILAARYEMARELAVDVDKERWQKVIAFAYQRGQYELALQLCGKSCRSADELIDVLVAAPIGTPPTEAVSRLALFVREAGHS